MDDEIDQQAASEGDPLAAITGDDLCDFVDLPAAAIELGLKQDGKPSTGESEQAGRRVLARCDWYALDAANPGGGQIGVTTRVHLFDGNAHESLKKAFAELPHKSVPDLGDNASYMYAPEANDSGTDWSILAAVLDFDDYCVRVMIEVWDREATEEQLSGIMRRVLPHIEANLQ